MASKKGERPLWKANREVTFEPACLPEFGLDVSWAMCRNPMCENFGVFFKGSIRKGRTASSDDNYRVSIKVVTATHTDKNENKVTSRWLAGQIECRRCGQCSRLASDRAIRPIARYYLSLSLPFADCANPECPNHGINVFEHWKERPKGQSRQSRQSRHYRENGRNHQVCCVHCGSRAVRRGRRERRSDLIEEAKKSQKNGGKKKPIKHEPYSPYISLGEVMRPHGVNGATRQIWGKIIEGVRTGRSVTDTYEIIEDLSISTYYRHLDRIAARLRDYHSARNVRLLHPSYATWDEPIQLYTDVLDVSLQAWEKGNRHVLLKYIVTTVPAGDTIFILAAHPFFLPERLCPSDSDRDRDDPKLRVEFEREWVGLHHEGIAREPGLSSEYVKKNFPEIGRGGYFIRSPYAEVAHFLTVQKMHCYMDAAKELYTAALVAMRGRIMTGKPGAGRPADGRRRDLPTTEIVLFQHKKKDRVRKAKVYTDAYEDLSFEKRHEKRKESLEKAWVKAEKRIRKKSITALKKELTKHKKKNLTQELNLLPKKKIKWSTLSPDEKASARRKAHRKAFTGGYSKYGGWVWLKFPPDSAMYRTPRTLWLTRMPGKRFEHHGKDILMKAWLQPVDSVLNSIRARVRGAHRPLTRAIGRGFAQNYVLPKIVQNELTIYLLGRNYSLRRKTKQLVVPAVNLKLARRDFRAELLRLMLMDDRDKAVALLKKHAKPAKEIPVEPPKKPPQRLPKRLLKKEDLDAAIEMIDNSPKEAIKRLRKAPPAARLDYLKHAWEFRLGITDAERISKWLRT